MKICASASCLYVAVHLVTALVLYFFWSHVFQRCTNTLKLEKLDLSDSAVCLNTTQCFCWFVCGKMGTNSLGACYSSSKA